MSKREKLRTRLINKTNGHCGYCGCVLFHSGKQWHKWQIDHILPKKKGGTDEEDNLMPSCPSCNKYKQVATLEQFREIVQNTIQVLNKNSTAYKVAKRFRLIEETNDRIVFYFEKI